MRASSRTPIIFWRLTITSKGIAVAKQPRRPEGPILAEIKGMQWTRSSAPNDKIVVMVL